MCGLCRFDEVEPACFNVRLELTQRDPLKHSRVLEGYIDLGNTAQLGEEVVTC